MAHCLCSNFDTAKYNANLALQTPIFGVFFFTGGFGFAVVSVWTKIILGNIPYCSFCFEEDI
jgi:hypothetical protein